MPEVSFDDPPVTEVAIGIQFSDPLPLAVVHYGAVWQEFSQRYPSYSEQPALRQVVETFQGEPAPPGPTVPFPRAPFRVWFANDDNGGLVQVQSDRFVFNWRRHEGGPAYPRFAWVAERFQEEFNRFRELLQQLEVEMPVIDLVDVTYVNHIVSGDIWKTHAELGAVFPGMSLPSTTSAGITTEEADVRVQFGTIGEDGEPGKLHFRVFPAIRRSDERAIFVANLVARRRPKEQTTESLIAAIQDGHDWVVRVFHDSTSGEMHAAWGSE